MFSTGTSYTAPAKVILFGEHAVVYGQPAIAVPFNTLHASAQAQLSPLGSGLTIHSHDLNMVWRTTSFEQQVDHALMYAVQLTLQTLGVNQIPDLTIELQSDIPLASGFGSGAAITTVLIRAISHTIGQPLEGDALNALVYEVEKLYHGTPSGIDNTVIVYNMPVFFIRGEVPTPFTVGQPLTFVIANTGQAASTKECVSAVRALVEGNPSLYGRSVEQIGELTWEARRQIEQGDLVRLGQLMEHNHTLLQQLTVSSDSLDRLVETALSGGALGAKMSGGGRGGNMIALVNPTEAANIEQKLRTAGALYTWIMMISPNPKEGMTSDANVS